MVEVGIFPLPEVSAELAKFVEARLHTDTPTSPFHDEIIGLRDRLSGTETNPVYVVIDPDTEEILAKKVGAWLDPAACVAFLRAAAGD